ncbi:MAG: iron-containing alcohol dehydrogenase, partial [Pedobacter sp.]
HAKTLAVVLPGMLKIRLDDKRLKLLQYGERVWGITVGDEDARIDVAIEKTRAFFESMRVPTRLKDYGLTATCIPPVLEQLKAHGMVTLGERSNVTTELVQKVLEQCL